MASEGSLAVCIDEALGRKLAPILRELRAPGAPAIEDTRELGLSGCSDEVLMAELRKRGFTIMVTKDSRILNAALRRAAWQASGLSLFILDGKWGNFRLFEQARRLIWWWPSVVEQAVAGPAGGAWRIAPDLQPSGMQQLFLPPAEPQSLS